MSNLGGDYDAFLAGKGVAAPSGGLPTEDITINPMLFDWQSDIVRWALQRGRAAIWADCGLGKTPMQLEWALHVSALTGGDVLVLAPLAVAQQTVREGRKFGVEVTHARSQADIRPGINITNYERLHLFDAGHFMGVVLDESSVLKAFMSKTKMLIIELFKETPYKLACTATPAPNDHMELGNHAEFLNVMPANEMLSRWFINDTMNFGTYRLKGHAVKSFWEWVSSWAVCVSKPSDMGYPDDGFTLPELNLETHVLAVDHFEASEGKLFRLPAVNAIEVHKEKRRTNASRAAFTADLVNGDDETWIIWVDTDYEADEIKKLVPGAVEVRGSQKDDEKERGLVSFSIGAVRVIITKPSIAGFGLNWQHCHNVAFMGISYSYEQLYQAIRRSHRFGQKNRVNVHLVLAETEQVVLDSLQRKQRDHEAMQSNMYRFNFKKNDTKNLSLVLRENVQEETGEGWRVVNGDCVERIKEVADNSIHFSVFSPPFSNLYIYSDSVRDMGNCKNDLEFFRQYSFLTKELFRVIMPGRLVAVHCKDLVDYKGRDGMAGLRDFPGAIIRAMERRGWKYHSKITIWKCPVTEMTRTKAQGLLYKQIRKDSAFCRNGLAEYLVIFRKPGDNPEPITHDKNSFPLEQWQRIAEPSWPPREFVESGTWFRVNQMDCLNKIQAKEKNDEKHICPLQLDVIERSLKLWTNQGDLVLDPFSGIGSTGYVAVKRCRRYLGFELKESYWRDSIRHLKRAETESCEMPLLAGIGQ